MCSFEKFEPPNSWSRCVGAVMRDANGELVAKDQNVESLIMESHSARVIKAITEGIAYLASIIREILMLSRNFTSSAFTHIFRYANFVANNLANFAFYHLSY